MSPLRRRKSRTSRARARHQQLVQRERLEYGSERTEQQPKEAPEASQPEQTAEERPPSRAFQPRRSRVSRVPADSRRRRRRLRLPRFGGLRAASASGARATVRQTGPDARRLLGGIGRALAWLLAWPLRLAALVARLITGLFAGIRSVGGRSLELAERYATPERVLVVVTAGAAACLAYSQFVDYRGVEVGQPQYSQVSTIAPPPQTSRVLAGDAHAYVLVPLAAIALASAVVALVSGRWRLGRLVSVIGLIGVAISLAIDLPKGLDAGTAGTAFAGARATLTDGFYAQLAASAVLVLCGWVLSINLRQRAGAVTGRRRARRRRLRPRRAPSVAGGGA
ncbi:MAG: hypothetical protein AABM43_08565 [Actinomycetota bacterium]